MSLVGPALFTLLSTDSGVKAIVSARVYPHGSATNPAMPYVTYVAPLGDRPVYVHNGDAPALEFVQIQVDWWATSYGAAVTLGDAVMAALECKSVSITGWGTARLLSSGGWPVESATEGGTPYWRGTRRYWLLLASEEVEDGD
jgi:hypothetical protein